MIKIQILVIDDNRIHTEQLVDLLAGKTIVEGHTISVDCETDFSKGLDRLGDKEYDIVILDVYKGDPIEANKDLQGAMILEEIKKTVPITVILYTGLPRHVEDLKSEIVRVVKKDEGDIVAEIEYLIRFGFLFIKKRLNAHIRKELTSYYWEIAEKHPDIIDTESKNHLFEHLLARRLALTLNNEGISQIFGESIGQDKVHPLSLYIFQPDVNLGYAMGDVLQKEPDGSYWIILTPTCDLQNKKADYVMLAKAESLVEHRDYKQYESKRGKDATNSMKKLIGSRKSDRYYFLPRIEMISMPDLVVDLQIISSLPMGDLAGYKRVAKLDETYSRDLQAKFTRYQNRPGSPDIDAGHVINYLCGDSEQ